MRWVAVCVSVAVSMCVFYTLYCLQCSSVINWLTESAELAEPTLGKLRTHTPTHANLTGGAACVNLLRTCTVTCSQISLTMLGGYTSVQVCCARVSCGCTNQRYCHCAHISLSVFIKHPVAGSQKPTDVTLFLQPVCSRGPRGKADKSLG